MSCTDEIINGRRELVIKDKRCLMLTNIDMGYNGIIKIDGEVSMLTNHGIKANGDLIIEGTPNSVLNITCMNKYKPCIGYYIQDDEYNSNAKLNRIILKNITMVLESKTDNFSIGTFGTEDIPTVILDKSSIIAPEFKNNKQLHSRLSINENIDSLDKYIYTLEEQEVFSSVNKEYCNYLLETLNEEELQYIVTKFLENHPSESS